MSGIRINILANFAGQAWSALMTLALVLSEMAQEDGIAVFFAARAAGSKQQHLEWLIRVHSKMGMVCLGSHRCKGVFTTIRS